MSKFELIFIQVYHTMTNKIFKWYFSCRVSDILSFYIMYSGCYLYRIYWFRMNFFSWFLIFLKLWIVNVQEGEDNFGISFILDILQHKKHTLIHEAPRRRRSWWVVWPLYPRHCITDYSNIVTWLHNMVPRV